MGRVRAAHAVIIIGLRLACCAFLIYIGGLWLSYTVDVANLMLNAVALEFILNTDELLYDAAVPRACRHVTDKLAPIRH